VALVRAPKIVEAVLDRQPTKRVKLEDFVRLHHLFLATGGSLPAGRRRLPNEAA
jgi:hypothetical protein